MKNIPKDWLENPNMQNLDVYNVLIDKLMSLRKIPSYAYGILNIKQVPMNRYEYWNINILVPVNINWEKVHITNFTSTIDTKLCSVYFNVFHKTIALRKSVPYLGVSIGSINPKP